MFKWYVCFAKFTTSLINGLLYYNESTIKNLLKSCNYIIDVTVIFMLSFNVFIFEISSLNFNPYLKLDPDGLLYFSKVVFECCVVACIHSLNFNWWCDYLNTW